MQCDEILAELCVGPCPRGADDIDLLAHVSGITAVVNLQTDRDFAYLGLDWPGLAQRYQQRNITVRNISA